MASAGGESAKAFVAFMFRRFRNAFLITAISLLFVFLHCQVKEQWIEKVFKSMANNRQKAIMVDRSLIASDSGVIGSQPSVTRTNQLSHGFDFRELSMRNPTMENFSLSYKIDRAKLINGLKGENMAYQAPEKLLEEQNAARSREFKNNLLSSKRNNGNMTPYSKPDSRVSHSKKRALRKYWLDEFTSDIPRKLQLLLQEMLLRDFESHKSSIPSENENFSIRCKRGFFRLKGMNSCHEWLKCKDIEKLPGGDVYGNGVGKIIHASKWRNKYDVAIVSLRQDRYKYKHFVNRVQSGVDNILLVQPSPYATQIVGMCDRGNNTVMVMEGCKWGNFRAFYASGNFRKLSPLQKFKFAIQIVAEYDYLHRGLGLPRVHCDVHTIIQAFGQWLVSEDLRLFLNDLDEIPTVDKQKGTLATCDCEPMGIMEQPGFLSPEIRYTQREFNEESCRKPVDEASDIWKIPDITANILVSQRGKRYFEILESGDFEYFFKSELKSIHDRCKRHNPVERPSSKEILIEYLKLYSTLLQNDANV